MGRSWEEKRKNGYIDVYVYLYSPAETRLKEMQKKAEGWCIERRYIPHYVIDREGRDNLTSLMYLGKLEGYKKFIIYSPDNIGEDIINILFTIGLRGVEEFESIDGWEFPKIVSDLMRRQKEISQEKLFAGRRKKAKEGIFIGSDPPYGYRKNKNPNIHKDLVEDTYEAFVVRYVYYRKELGYGCGSIATELTMRGFTNRGEKTFNRSSVNKILNNEDIYKGYLTQEGMRVKGHYTPLLNEDGTVDMSYIGNRFDIEAEEKQAKNSRKRKFRPDFIKPCERDKNGVIRRL